jgi:hypothetical protein
LLLFVNDEEHEYDERCEHFQASSRVSTALQADLDYFSSLGIGINPLIAAGRARAPDRVSDRRGALSELGVVILP